MPSIFEPHAVRRRLGLNVRMQERRGSNMATTKNTIYKAGGTAANNKAIAKMFRQGGHKIRAVRSDAGKKRKWLQNFSF